MNDIDLEAERLKDEDYLNEIPDKRYYKNKNYNKEKVSFSKIFKIVFYTISSLILIFFVINIMIILISIFIFAMTGTGFSDVFKYFQLINYLISTR